jgi:hypothetical protein
MRSYLAKLPTKRVAELVKSRLKEILNQFAPLQEVPAAGAGSQPPTPTTPQPAKTVASTPQRPHTQIMTEPKKNALNAKQLAITLKASGAPALKALPEKKVAKILALGFAEIGKQLKAVETGTLRVRGLGVFRAKSREVEKDGKKLKVRRVGFAASKPKQPKPKSTPLAGGTGKKA